MNAFAAIVEECGGVDKIKLLRQHENVEINSKAFEIIERYFGTDSDTNVGVSGSGDSATA